MQTGNLTHLHARGYKSRNDENGVGDVHSGFNPCISVEAD